MLFSTPTHVENALSKIYSELSRASAFCQFLRRSARPAKFSAKLVARAFCTYSHAGIIFDHGIFYSNSRRITRQENLQRNKSHQRFLPIPTQEHVPSEIFSEINRAHFLRLFQRRSNLTPRPGPQQNTPCCIHQLLSPFPLAAAKQ